MRQYEYTQFSFPYCFSSRRKTVATVNAHKQFIILRGSTGKERERERDLSCDPVVVCNVDMRDSLPTASLCRRVDGDTKPPTRQQYDIGDM